MRFYSKKGPFLSIVIWGTFVFMVCSTILAIGQKQEVTGSIILIVTTFVFGGFIIWFWFGTYYEIGEKILKVVGGPIRYKVEISSITSIKSSRNPLSSPALSLDRLEIKYGKWGFILISPKNEEKFCEILKERNQNIVLDLKRK